MGLCLQVAGEAICFYGHLRKDQTSSQVSKSKLYPLRSVPSLLQGHASINTVSQVSS
jgi:hypothetical protein